MIVIFGDIEQIFSDVLSQSIITENGDLAKENLSMPQRFFDNAFPGVRTLRGGSWAFSSLRLMTNFAFESRAGV